MALVAAAPEAQTEPMEWEHIGLAGVHTFTFYPGAEPSGSRDTIVVSGYALDSFGDDTEVLYRRGLTEADWANVMPRTNGRTIATVGSGCVLIGNGAGPLRIKRTCDGGRTWVDGLEGGAEPPYLYVDCLYHRPSDGAVIGCHERRDDLVISHDDGLTWSLLGADFPSAAGQPRDLAEHPTAAPGGGPRLVVGLQGYGYAYSDDGGLTWTPSNAWNAGQYLPDDLAIDPVDGTEYDGRLYAMTNDGLSPDPRMGEALLASDDGATWWLVRHFPTGFGDVTVAGDGSVWVGTSESTERRGRVWRSRDGGQTWEDVSGAPKAGGYSGLPIWEILPGPDGRMYVGGGFRQGGPPAPGGGLWRTVDPVFPVAEEPAPEAGTLDLTVRPNPAGSSTEVEVRLGAGAPPTEAVVTVHDARGREVTRLGGAVAGERTWRFDTSGWASGVYVVRGTAGTEAATATLTVVR